MMVAFFKIADKNKWYVGQEHIDWIGVFGTKHHIGTTLLKLDDWDLEYIIRNNVKLKGGEYIFRYVTDNMTAANDKQRPLIKINIVKGLVYFLKPEAETPDFETKGVKAKFLILKEGWFNYGY